MSMMLFFNFLWTTCAQMTGAPGCHLSRNIKWRVTSHSEMNVTLPAPLTLLSFFTADDCLAPHPRPMALIILFFPIKIRCSGVLGLDLILLRIV